MHILARSAGLKIERLNYRFFFCKKKDINLWTGVQYVNNNNKTKEDKHLEGICEEYKCMHVHKHKQILWK